MVQKCLTIFRAVNNWAHVGEKDGRTSAMWLGLANMPIKDEDLLWPGQLVPRPKRNKRKGMNVVA